MLNNIKITRTTQLATGVQVSTCEMYLTAPVQAYFQQEIFPHFAEVNLGIQRAIGSQFHYYLFNLTDEQTFNHILEQAGPFLQQQLKELNNTVVLVDDDPDDQFLVGQLLHQNYPEVVIKPLNNGEELLQALEYWPTLPSLILLDLNMPRMGGLETLERIRAEGRFHSLPIVILTTSENPTDRQRAVDLQASGYTLKPDSLQEFNQLIQNIKQQWLQGTD